MCKNPENRAFRTPNSHEKSPSWGPKPTRWYAKSPNAGGRWGTPGRPADQTSVRGPAVSETIGGICRSRTNSSKRQAPPDHCHIHHLRVRTTTTHAYAACRTYLTAFDYGMPMRAHPGPPSATGITLSNLIGRRHPQWRRRLHGSRLISKLSGS